MFLKQSYPTGWYTEFANGTHLANVHDSSLCEGRGCAIHNHPSDHPLKDAPLFWREDRGILEQLKYETLREIGKSGNLVIVPEDFGGMINLK